MITLAVHIDWRFQVDEARIVQICGAVFHNKIHPPPITPRFLFICSFMRTKIVKEPHFRFSMHHDALKKLVATYESGLEAGMVGPQNPTST